MRILHVIAEMGVGGAESMVAELVRSGSAVGWQSAVASAGGGRLPVVPAEAQVRHYFVPLTRRRPHRLVASIRHLRAALVDFRPDVVIAHNVGVTVIASLALATTRSRVPLISVFHGVQPSDYRRAGQVLDHCADHVVAVSDSLRVNLARAGMRRSDTHVIPNAVALPALPPRSAARRSLGLDPDVPVALCLARLVAQKRHDVLLRAWAQLEQHAVLLLAGDGDQRPAHERLARELGVASRVRFLGYRDDVPTLLAAADLTTLASDWEGLPMAVLESMGAGLPFVGTAVDGVREVVRPGEGALVPANDPDALTGALADLLFDAAACRNAGAAARRGVMARYDLNTMVTRYAQLVRVARARGGLDTESEHPGTGK